MGRSAIEMLAEVSDRINTSNPAATAQTSMALAATADAFVAAASGLRLLGYVVRESATVAAAAAIEVRHGATAAGGQMISPATLAADGMTEKWYGPNGISMPNGISILVAAGTVDIAVFYTTD